MQRLLHRERNGPDGREIMPQIGQWLSGRIERLEAQINLIAAAARRKQIAETIRADQPARFSVALVSDAAKNVSGQVFGVSGENIILYSQPRAIETLAKPEGWTVDTILSEALPKMSDKFYSLARPPLTPTPAPAA